MMAFIVCIVCLVLLAFGIRNNYLYYKKANALFNVKGELNVQTLILFSNNELISRIMKILKETGEDLKIQCGDTYYMTISSNIKPCELCGKLDLLQSLMIHKRYDGKNEIVIKDSIDKIIFDIWLDYGHNPRYRNILRREIAMLLERGDISNSTYNEIYRRVYLFERNALNTGGVVK